MAATALLAAAALLAATAEQTATLLAAASALLAASRLLAAAALLATTTAEDAVHQPAGKGLRTQRNAQHERSNKQFGLHGPRSPFPGN